MAIIDPVALPQQLIKFDTTNTPGAEAACVDYVAQLLADAGLDTKTNALDGNRPKLVARLPGRGSAPPLLMHGHVDLVQATGQPWWIIT